MPKILIGDSLSKEGIKILQQGPGFEVDYKPDITPEELKSIIPQYDALVVRSRTKVPKDVIDVADRLKLIGRAGAGVDTIDVEAATKKGIIVMNTPGGNTISTAELAFGMMLALVRKIPQAHITMLEGKWDKKSFVGHEVNEKTLGIIGFGRIGREMAKRALACGMRLIAYDPYVAPEIFKQYATERVDLETLLRQADIITIHATGGAETKYMINEKEFGMMKPGVFIVNCARGSIMNEMALVKALTEGKVAGAALDVFEKEPLDPEHPLRKAPNVILTPHIAASTHEAQLNVAVQIAQQIVEALTGGTIRNAVNAPSIDPSLEKQMRPYLDLAEKIGKFQSQFAQARLTKLVMKYNGAVLDFPVEHLTTAAIKGFIEHITDEPVNYVNARCLAREYGIVIEETKVNEPIPYANLITMEAYMETGKVNTVSGTLFTPTTPRFVIINDKHFDAYPEGNMIVIENKDVPGIIGSVGTLLGSHNINIAQMTWGRTDHSREAMTVINVDQEVPPEILEKITKLSNVISARLIKI